MDAAVFIVCAVMVLSGAFGVLLARNPVHAALFLVQSVFGVAVRFLLLDATFLAAVQGIVYAGAIVILFLFVIMLLGVDRVDDLDVFDGRGQWGPNEDSNAPSRALVLPPLPFLSLRTLTVTRVKLMTSARTTRSSGCSASSVSSLQARE